MREIQGQARTVRELLKGVKYSVDYYQREYKWQEKQIRELIIIRVVGLTSPPPVAQAQMEKQ